MNTYTILLVVNRSVMADSLQPLWTVKAHQAPLSMGFPRQENWRETPFPTPGDLPNSGIKPASPALGGRFFTTESPRKPIRRQYYTTLLKKKKQNLHLIAWSRHNDYPHFRGNKLRERLGFLPKVTDLTGGGAGIQIWSALPHNWWSQLPSWVCLPVGLIISLKQ